MAITTKQQRQQLGRHVPGPRAAVISALTYGSVQQATRSIYLNDADIKNNWNNIFLRRNFNIPNKVYRCPSDA